MKNIAGLAIVFLLAQTSIADEKVEAAIGGGVGGAVGAVIGQELGDREGAIVGAGVGAAVGAAIATDGNGNERHERSEGIVAVQVKTPSAHGKHCPPGQAKKGRC